MPIALEDIRIMLEFAEKENRQESGKGLGDLLAEIGRRVEGAKPTEDVRMLREDEDVFG